MYSVDSESDEEEIALNNYHKSEDDYDIFERVRKNSVNDDIFSKYIGKNRFYVFFILKVFNPFSKLIFRTSTLSNILRYKENRRVIYIFYNEHTKQVTNIKKVIPRK